MNTALTQLTRVHEEEGVWRPGLLVLSHLTRLSKGDVWNRQNDLETGHAGAQGNPLLSLPVRDSQCPYPLMESVSAFQHPHILGFEHFMAHLTGTCIGHLWKQACLGEEVTAPLWMTCAPLQVVSKGAQGQQLKGMICF